MAVRLDLRPVPYIIPGYGFQTIKLYRIIFTDSQI